MFDPSAGGAHGSKFIHEMQSLALGCMKEDALQFSAFMRRGVTDNGGVSNGIDRLPRNLLQKALAAECFSV
jgi:hypothetical protein